MLIKSYSITEFLVNFTGYASDNVRPQQAKDNDQAGNRIANIAISVISDLKIEQVFLSSLYQKISSNIEIALPGIPNTLASIIACYAIPYFDIVANHVSCHRYERVDKGLQKMRCQGSKPDRQTYINLLHILIEEKVEQGAWAIFNLMEKDDIFLRRESYSDLLNLLVEAKSPERICIVLNTMNNKGLKPDSKISNILIAFFAKNGNQSSALKLFQQLKTQRIKPSRLAYNFLLHLFIKRKNQSKVDELFMEMKRYRIKLDRLNSLILLEK